MPIDATAVDLSSPNLVDLLDALSRAQTNEQAVVATSINLSDVDRIPIQRGLATVERYGLLLLVAEEDLRLVLQSAYPGLNAAVGETEADNSGLDTAIDDMSTGSQA